MFIQYVRISVFVQPRRVHLFIVNCLLKNKFNIHVIYYLHIYTVKPNLHATNIIWLKFTINYSLCKFNYNRRHCSSISLTVVMCVCTRRVFVSLLYWSAKQCDWLSFAGPAPFPFPIFLFPGPRPFTQIQRIWLDVSQPITRKNLSKDCIFSRNFRIFFFAHFSHFFTKQIEAKIRENAKSFTFHFKLQKWDLSHFPNHYKRFCWI